MVRTSVILISLLLFTTALQNSQAKKCRFIGEKCSKTVFDKCCGENVCQLSSPFNGVCVKCLSGGAACVMDKHCCSRKCDWGKCKKDRFY
ncbi:unnamed protein product [Trichobilharzia szidati]|nr:unnamed protein product [Trichobilharzia szidati]